MVRRFTMVLMAAVMLAACGKEEPAVKPWVATFPDWRVPNATPDVTLRVLEEARGRAKALVAAMQAGKVQEAEAFRGQVVSFTGQQMGGGLSEWLFQTPDGVMCKALVGRNKTFADTPSLRVRSITATGPLKAVDVGKKEVVIDDVDLVLDTWAGR